MSDDDRHTRNAEPTTLDIKAISPEQLSELKSFLSEDCEVIPRSDAAFQRHARLFNGSIQSPSCLLVRVTQAEDVSHLVRFATRHCFTLSVKAGGYGTAGYAIQGDIIVDLCSMVDIDIEPPRPLALPDTANSSSPHDHDNILAANLSPGEYMEMQYTSLRDMPLKKGKGKDTVVGFKRRGDDEISFEPNTRNDHRIPSDGDASSFRPLKVHPNFPSFTRQRTNTMPKIPGPALDTSEENGSNGVASSQKEGESRRTSDPHTAHATPDVDGTSLPVSNSLEQETPHTSPFPTSHLSDMNASPNQTIQPIQPPFTSTPSSLSTSFFSNQTHYLNTALPFPSLNPNAELPLTELQPLYPYAYVTFSAGAYLKDIDLFTHSHPLPATRGEGYLPYHIPSSAHPVGSSSMLLGGFGFLSRLYGLSIDNLVEVEMVLADGSVVIVNKYENQDLWWAIRGAGPAFGIVTRFKAKAYPIPSVYAGALVYNFHPSTAISLIKHIRDCLVDAPRELYVLILMTAGPPGQGAIIAIEICYAGPRDKGQIYYDKIRAWDGEPCLMNDVNTKSFVMQQESMEKILKGIWGRKWFIRSDLIHSLPDDLISQTVLKFSRTPMGCTWLFELAGGAIMDYEDTCFPKSRREAAWTVAAFHQWDIENDDPACVLAAEEWIERMLKEQSSGGPFPAFLAWKETRQRTKGSFGDNWEHLMELKRKYDPNNVFRHTFLSCAGD